MEKYISIGKAAYLLGVSLSTMYRWLLHCVYKFDLVKVVSHSKCAHLELKPKK